MNLKKLAIPLLCVTTLSASSMTVVASTAETHQQSQQTVDFEWLFQQGAFEKIIEALSEIKNKTPEQHNMLVSALMNTDLDDAEEASERFIRAYSNDYRAYHTHASVMGAQASSSIFSALGYAKKAKQSLEQAVEIAPDEIAVYQALMRFHLMAPSIAGGDIDEAKKLAQHIATLDDIEGQFALAKVYLEDDQEGEAKTLYAPLLERDDTQIRARFELGNYYLTDEQFQASYDILLPLSAMQVPVVDKADNEQWDKYEESMSRLLYGKYRLGQVAVKSGQYTQEGIQALKRYLQEYDDTIIDTQSLPTPSWAKLRLAELLLNANALSEAEDLIKQIGEDDDKNFSKILKQLKKELKKRAAV